MLPVALRARIHPLNNLVSVLHRRVQLLEIDTNLHMNQAVYAEVFELGRVHWMVGTGAWLSWRKQGVHPVVGQQTLTYRRELAPLQRYRIETRALGTDGRMLIVQGVIAVGDQVHTTSEARMLLVGPEGVLTPDQVAQLTKPLLTDPLRIEDWRVQP